MMFFFSFFVLFVLSAAALAASVAGVDRRHEHLSKVRLNVGAYIHFTFVATLAVVLATRSDFVARYEVLGFMIFSFLVDYFYFYRVSEANAANKPAPRRRWWPIIDNSAWLVALVLLYVA